MTAIERDRVLGGLYGLLIGDALGVPYEFKEPTALPALKLIDMEPPEGFPRSHPGVAVGYWSDDGAQALCLLASLLFCGHLDLEDLGRRFRNWHQHGYLAAGGQVFDIGIQTSRAFARLAEGVPAEQAGPDGEWDNGNGSLMRVLPLALWHRGSDQELFFDACRQSKVTHGHARAQICCGLYCLWARAEIKGQADSWSWAVATTRRLLQDRSDWSREFSRHIAPNREPGGKGSGYVVDCLHSARLALQADTFSEVVKGAVALGNDTDTTAAVAGGIAGLRYGFSAIPHRWLTLLADQHLFEPLIEDLGQHLQWAT